MILNGDSIGTRHQPEPSRRRTGGTIRRSGGRPTVVLLPGLPYDRTDVIPEIPTKVYVTRPRVI